MEKPVFPGSAVFWDSICQETARWLSCSIPLHAAAALAAPGTAGEAELVSTAAMGLTCSGLLLAVVGLCWLSPTSAAPSKCVFGTSCPQPLAVA